MVKEVIEPMLGEGLPEGKLQVSYYYGMVEDMNESGTQNIPGEAALI
jgi:hypothetical protein